MRYYCNICKKDITKAEFLYSIDKFDRALCREHQQQERNKTESQIKAPVKHNEEKESTSSEESIDIKTSSPKNSLFRRAVVATGRGIVKGVKKIADSTRKTIQIRRWKDDILRRMTMSQLKRLCFEKRVSTKRSEMKQNRSGDFYWKEYNCTKPELVSRLKNKVYLDDIISFAKRNHVNIRDIIADISRKKAEWKIKELNERMEKEGINFIKELEKAIYEFKPPRKYYGKEILYQDTLATHLKNEFPEGDVEVEVARGPVRPDIVVNEVAIEIKGPTRDKDLETISHKCILYDQYFHGGLICVLFNVYVNQRRYDAWLKGINNNYPNVIIIRK